MIWRLQALLSNGICYCYQKVVELHVCSLRERRHSTP